MDNQVFSIGERFFEYLEEVRIEVSHQIVVNLIVVLFSAPRGTGYVSLDSEIWRESEIVLVVEGNVLASLVDLKVGFGVFNLDRVNLVPYNLLAVFGKLN